MRKSLTNLLPLLAVLLVMPLTGCLKSDVVDYEDWRNENDAYLKTINTSEFETISPAWAPLDTVYMKWHNDRSLTASNLVPMSTSTVEMKYELETIDGTKVENTYSKKDSVFTCTPANGIVTGMVIALTTMHVGDSVTLVIPYTSGYGADIRPNLRPYSNLIYHLKLKAIKAFEKPASRTVSI